MQEKQRENKGEKTDWEQQENGQSKTIKLKKKNW